jgi:hypothetical protein
MGSIMLPIFAAARIISEKPLNPFPGLHPHATGAAGIYTSRQI